MSRRNTKYRILKQQHYSWKSLGSYITIGIKMGEHIKNTVRIIPSDRQNLQSELVALRKWNLSQQRKLKTLPKQNHCDFISDTSIREFPNHTIIIENRCKMIVPVLEFSKLRIVDVSIEGLNRKNFITICWLLLWLGQIYYFGSVHSMQMISMRLLISLLLIFTVC